jgi:hypothetical protein
VPGCRAKPRSSEAKDSEDEDMDGNH